MKKNILVFPCGSEIALEVHRSLEHSIHFNLIGGNSIDDHGKFVFKNYIGGIPFANEPDFLPSLKSIILENKIDAIYPAMDSVINILKQNEEYLNCLIVAPIAETTNICLSKSRTYKALNGLIATPKVYESLSDVIEFPVFMKPDIGYGSRGAIKINDLEKGLFEISKNPNLIICEYLPGKEYTVDCFTNKDGELLFVGPRERERVSNGISVNSKTIPEKEQFNEIAIRINNVLKFNGAWFFQVKEAINGELVLLEVASRLGGSSGVNRAKGVNFASLSLFSSFNFQTEIIEHPFEVEMDRALDNIFKINLSFKHVYVDFDDTLVVDNQVNSKLVGKLFSLINDGKIIHLITKHSGNINETLTKYRLTPIFDSIIHLKKIENKYEFITNLDSIFIDDSFSERKDVFRKLGIPTFGVDMIDAIN
jgi:predicted ATP-grasp superfamily ATP-dependent carboligase